MEIKKYSVNTDGGSRGNPGPAAIGLVIRDQDGKIIEEFGKTIGNQTNNYAEYFALITALEKLKSFGATQVECILDSELVVKQLKGEYKVKELTLQRMHQQVLVLSNNFDQVVFRHVRREQNKEADKLVNRALDGFI
jgi:ribonuclease HI